MKETNNWNAKQYDKHASFVSNLAMPLIDLLNAKQNEKILDLGCGDGTLALEIKKQTNNLICIDLSHDMVKIAKQKGLNAFVKDATNLNFNNEFDAIFSNATLHWIKQKELVIKNIHKSLKTNGRFIAEFGGFGNIKFIIKAIDEVFNKNKKYGTFNNPWYFPKENEYKKLLQNNGFEVKYIKLIPRPTIINDMSNWLDIFINGIIEHLSIKDKKEFKKKVRDILKSKLYSKDKGWQADYVRLRIEAKKL